MSGKLRYLLDTNAIIALLKGKRELVEKLNGADWVGISIISSLEFLCFPSLTDQDRALFHDFISKLEVVALSHTETTLNASIIDIRKTKKLKLPDAIVLATALSKQAILLTNDLQLTTYPNVETY